MVEYRYDGFRLTSGSKVFYFYRQHFRELIINLALNEKYSEELSTQLLLREDFKIGDIIVKYTPHGCIWKSPRRVIHRTSGQVIRLNNNQLNDLYILLRDKMYDKQHLGYYIKRRNVKKHGRVRYTRNYSALFCFIYGIRIINTDYYPPLVVNTYSKLRRRKNNYPRKKQVHGVKTVSNHYIKCMENIDRLFDPP